MNKATGTQNSFHCKYYHIQVYDIKEARRRAEGQYKTGNRISGKIWESRRSKHIQRLGHTHVCMPLDKQLKL